ncbi:MAG: hypothetical protein KF898_10225 [Parachlamydiales bacterium]|nr:hypothetical protein [Verrucomicrobiota bacterium]MBX3720011.1 hypothetical protein [Candidatus Acheromyda pituitae]
MKKVICSLFCAVGLIGSINAGVIAQNCSESMDAAVLTSMEDLSDELFCGGLQEINNRCRKCGKPK